MKPSLTLLIVMLPLQVALRANEDYQHYDCFEQPGLHHAAKDWPQFVRRMGDFQKPILLETK